MKVWSTKFVLTGGIEEAEVDDSFLAKVCSTEMIPNKRAIEATVMRNGEPLQLWLDGENREWHRTREGAVRRATKLRDERVESLRKQIERLECMSFA